MYSLHVIETLVASLVFSYLAIAWARVVGLTDRPDRRKRHVGHIPLAGGPAIMLTFATITLLYGNGAFGHLGLMLLALVFLVGMVDDWTGASPLLRLLAQFLCGTLMALLGGIVIHNVGNLLGLGKIPLLMLAVPLTALSFAGLANAFNMIDGVDGLASGLALVPLSLLAALAWQSGSELLPTLLALLIPLAVFMLFNLGPDSRLAPKMFLGDSGSGLLGFVLCAALIVMSQGADAIIRPVAALWLVAVPLMDMLATMALRLRAGVHPMRADRRHLHHTLLDAGLSPRRVTTLLLGSSLVLGLLGLWLSTQSEMLAMLLYFALFAGHCAAVFLLRRQLDNTGCEASP